MSSKDKTINNNTTPEFNKSVARDLKDSVKVSIKEPSSETIDENIDFEGLISKSYSPTINRLIGDLESLSAYPWALNCSNNQQINIKKSGIWTCVDWESKEAQDLMLRNLRRKKGNYDKVVGPAQIQKNCWFNVFFVTFFISKKGRKFFKHLRYLMITGKFADKRENVFSESLRWPFFLLNYYIDSSIMGLEDPINFAETMNTNTLLLEIGRTLITKFPELSSVDNLMLVGVCPTKIVPSVIASIEAPLLKASPSNPPKFIAPSSSPELIPPPARDFSKVK